MAFSRTILIPLSEVVLTTIPFNAIAYLSTEWPWPLEATIKLWFVATILISLLISFVENGEKTTMGLLWYIPPKSLEASSIEGPLNVIGPYERGVSPTPLHLAHQPKAHSLPPWPPWYSRGSHTHVNNQKKSGIGMIQWNDLSQTRWHASRNLIFPSKRSLAQSIAPIHGIPL